MAHEAQSDLHQDAREKGYKEDPEPLKADYQKEIEKAKAAGYSFEDKGACPAATGSKTKMGKWLLRLAAMNMEPMTHSSNH